MSLAVTGVVVFIVGIVRNLAAVPTIGVLLVVAAILLPILTAFEVSFAKLSIRHETRDADYNFNNFVRDQGKSLQRFAVLLCQDLRVGRDITEQSLSHARVMAPGATHKELLYFVLCIIVRHARNQEALERLRADDIAPEPVLAARRVLDRAILLLHYHQLVDESQISHMLGQPLPDIRQTILAIATQRSSDFDTHE